MVSLSSAIALMLIGGPSLAMKVRLPRLSSSAKSRCGVGQAAVPSVFPPDDDLPHGVAGDRRERVVVRGPDLRRPVDGAGRRVVLRDEAVLSDRGRDGSVWQDVPRVVACDDRVALNNGDGGGLDERLRPDPARRDEILKPDGAAIRVELEQVTGDFGAAVAHARERLVADDEHRRERAGDVGVAGVVHRDRGGRRVLEGDAPERRAGRIELGDEEAGRRRRERRRAEADAAAVIRRGDHDVAARVDRDRSRRPRCRCR